MILFGALIALLFLFQYMTRYTYINNSNPEVEDTLTNREQPVASTNQLYTKQCLQLFRKLRYPNKSLFHNPPLDKPPPEMYDDFTQNGLMPIKRSWYFNDVQFSNDRSVIPESTIDSWLTSIRANKPLRYNDLSLRELMYTLEAAIKNKTIAVIGTIDPWIEAMAFELGATKITTLEYNNKKYEQAEFEWLHVNDYLDRALSDSDGKQLESFDNAASFSSIEHSGLGRFGDPLAPYGDVEAVKQVHCMIKPAGLFFLCVPTSQDGSSYIEFNAHRVYGSERLKLLFGDDWRLLAKKKDSAQLQTIFVLQKIARSKLF